MTSNETPIGRAGPTRDSSRTSREVREGPIPGIPVRLLSRHGARTAVFVTAWNPFGKNVGRVTNEISHAQLKSWLKRRCLAYLPGEGRGTIVDWPSEKSILVFGLQRPQSCTVGRTFRQNAVVYVAAGKSAELIKLR